MFWRVFGVTQRDEKFGHRRSGISSIRKFGSLLVSAAGMTLYHYTPDKHGTIKCTAACAKFWPPLLVKRGAQPKAGAGVSAAKLSTVKRPDGTTQVAYAGLTLYRYSGDKKPGDVRLDVGT